MPFCPIIQIIYNRLIDRRAIIADLDEYGGNVGNAIYDHLEDKGTPVAAGANSEATAQLDDVPFGPDDNAGTQSRNQATPTGNGRTSESTEGFNSERTPAGEQTQNLAFQPKLA